MTTTDRRLGPLISAGLFLGVGLGGFVDGILLHQILQWHNMLSSVTPPTDLIAMKYNMVWDGLFHAATWAMCAIGVWLLFRAGRHPSVVWSGRALLGRSTMSTPAAASARGTWRSSSSPGSG